jgi:fatty-acyl-CoA synthase
MSVSGDSSRLHPLHPSHAYHGATLPSVSLELTLSGERGYIPPGLLAPLNIAMLSYCKGSDVPLRRETIYEAFACAALAFPDRVALISRPDDTRWTYRELLDEVEKTASGLAGLGLQAGDRLGIWAASCREWILLQLACPRAGVVLVNVNPAYRATDLGYIIRKSKMAAIVRFPKDARADYDAILQEVRKEVRKDASCDETSHLKHDIRIGTESWRAMIAAGTKLPDVRIDSDSVANIQYTSGTTGNPKGVCLTHLGVVNNAWLLARGLGLTEFDRVCQNFPLYHCAGYTCSSLAALITGATFILPSRMFDARATLQTISEEGVTTIYGVPSMFIAELEHPDFDRFDMTSIQNAVVGGAPCPVELMRRMADRFGTQMIWDIYGQTEASPVITMSSKEDSLEQRVSTIGSAMPNTEVKIADIVTGDTLPVGQQGELCARGYFLMKGYDDDAEATRKAIDADGWLHTGDLAVMNPDGHFHITGRAKDMIIRGGENIYPREVENLLYTHAKVADAHVLGLPDERCGEIVIAWIRLKTGECASEEEIREFCRGKVAHFKIPEHIRFVEEFPMTASGKVQKFRIRQMEIDMRHLEDVAKIRTA